MASLAMMMLEASTPKIRPLTPAQYAAQCKAAAHVMQEGLSVEQYAWRDYGRDWSFWDSRHRNAQGDQEIRRTQDAEAEARFAAIGFGRNHPDRRAAAQPIAAYCRQARERAQ